MSYQEQTTTDQTVASTRDERLATHTLAETLASETGLGRFSALLRQTGLDRTVQDGEWVTVLAPQDDALAGAGPEGDDADRFVRHHIAQGAFTEAEIRRAGRLRMKDGSEVPVQVAGTEVRVGGARIVRADVQCMNGVIQVIDAALK